ncbi:MAG: hypothetical protein DYG89_26970 [Caldilinea sp. CFX5]|nr:hypothetical protein [Caldilinea sp. CFX5]
MVAVWRGGAIFLMITQRRGSTEMAKTKATRWRHALPCLFFNNISFGHVGGGMRFGGHAVNGVSLTDSQHDPVADALADYDLEDYDEEGLRPSYLPLVNQLWSANGKVIPFYFVFEEKKIWQTTLAINYYCAFASQYIAFFERDEELVSRPFSLEQIREYGFAKGIRAFVEDVDSLKNDQERGLYDLMWITASNAPHRFASVFDQRVLVILDEFQNCAAYVYPDMLFQTQPIESMPGSYHSLSESKVAPMLVTGSYPAWLRRIMGEYLEAGRLSEIHFSPYLTPEEGLQAVYKYAEVYEEPITNQTAQQINTLCMADPFFISCVIQSEFPERDLTTTEGMIEAVNYEITYRKSEMMRTWEEYIPLALKRVNDQHAKSILLHLSKHADREWTPRQLKEALALELSEAQIHEKLIQLAESDLIEEGTSNIDFHGLQDGTLNLILRSRFEKEISNFVPDLKQEFHQTIQALRTDKRRLQGHLNHLQGLLAEHLLAVEFRSRKRFALTDYFSGLPDNRKLTMVDVQERVTIQRPNGKAEEIDLIAKTREGIVVMVEVRKRQEPTDLPAVTELRDNVAHYAAQQGVVVWPAFLSLGGFPAEAKAFCHTHGIGIAEQMVYIDPELMQDE